MSDSLREQTIRGVGWNGVSQLVTQLFSFGISIVLARLLGPKAYGLIAMVTVFTGFANLFTGLGLGAAIIQRRELEARHLDTAFWVNVLCGAGMTLLLIGLAPGVAWFYHQPLLAALTAAIALKFVIDSFGIVHAAQLSRNLHFRSLAVIKVGASLIGGLTGLAMALGGLGVWSLVAQTLANSLAGILLTWRVSSWRPAWRFERLACRELFGYSASVVGFNVVNYWARTLDQLLIGRFVGADAVGIYSRAYSLMLLPLSQVSQVIGNVMFPAMSAIQHDLPKVRRAYLQAIGMIAFITFPTMTGLFAVADHFVLALLGAQWAATIPILKLFCWVGLVQSVLSTVGWIYTSLGRTSLYLIMGIIGSVAAVVTFFIGIRWGILGVAWAYVVLNAVWTIPLFEIPARMINLTFWQAARSLSGTFCCSMIMGMLVWGVGRLLPEGLAGWKCLVIQVPLGIVSYVALVAGFKLDVWREFRRIQSEFLLRRFRSHGATIAGPSPKSN